MILKNYSLYFIEDLTTLQIGFMNYAPDATTASSPPVRWFSTKNRSGRMDGEYSMREGRPTHEWWILELVQVTAKPCRTH